MDKFKRMLTKKMAEFMGTIKRAGVEDYKKYLVIEDKLPTDFVKIPKA